MCKFVGLLQPALGIAIVSVETLPPKGPQKALKSLTCTPLLCFYLNSPRAPMCVSLLGDSTSTGAARRCGAICEPSRAPHGVLHTRDFTTRLQMIRGPFVLIGPWVLNDKKPGGLQLAHRDFSESYPHHSDTVVDTATLIPHNLTLNIL